MSFFHKDGDKIEGRYAHQGPDTAASAKGPTPPAPVTTRDYSPSVVHILRRRALPGGAEQVGPGSEQATPYTLCPDY